MRYSIGLAACLLLLPLSAPSSLAAEPEVITLTQTRCQFIESEKEILKNPPHSYSGCEKLNKDSDGKRVFIPMTLKPGTYIMRVVNRDVPYDLGFWLRGKGLSRAILPSVSGGEIKLGESRDFKITLKKGNYLFSCPLNPTPNYPLKVE